MVLLLTVGLKMYVFTLRSTAFTLLLLLTLSYNFQRKFKREEKQNPVKIGQALSKQTLTYALIILIIWSYYRKNGSCTFEWKATPGRYMIWMTNCYSFIIFFNVNCFIICTTILMYHCIHYVCMHQWIHLCYVYLRMCVFLFKAPISW